MKRLISSHPQFDDMRHYRFTRNTGLPLGYFSRTDRTSWAKWIWPMSLLVLLLLVACLAGGAK